MQNKIGYKYEIGQSASKLNEPLTSLNPDFHYRNKRYVISIPQLSSKLINCTSTTYSSKKEINKSYFKENIHIYKDLINNIKILYDKSPLGKNMIPININFDDFDKNNNDSNYIFKNQNSQNQNLNIIGLTKYEGIPTKLGGIITSINVTSTIYSPSTLLHELGHVLDLAYLTKDGHILSDTDDFNIIKNKFTKEYNNIYANTNFTSDSKVKNYFLTPTEILARTFNVWYSEEIQKYKNDNYEKNIFDPFIQPHDLPSNYTVGEIIAYKIYDEHPEIEQFFTKHFGEIIPPENTKLYNKTHPNNSISDQSLLNKLNQAIKTAGLDKSKDFTIELEISN